MEEAQRTRITDGSVVRAAPTQVSSDLGDEVVVLELTAGAYFGLEGVGARVWQLLSEPRTVREIVQTLLEEYDVEAERCRRDLDALLERLLERGLVEIRGADSA
jgi:hypothetical protein